ncbi:MAG: hypothetical protein JNG88_11860 [Phycisphaerales bacterium]|nr:hypothetical protein [Phycisphaerales bacterium]
MVGCAVPQPRGGGALSHVVEPSTQNGYWLYLPSEYVRATEAERRTRRWPLVVSFHGMKPFDKAHSQALEWQQEADRFGYIVIAPQLSSPDVLYEFPLRHRTDEFQQDARASIAIVNHVLATTSADPSNVLSTSWSSGGYIAHYMVNQFPERFTCLAVRQSNFTTAVLDPAVVRRSLYHPVLIVFTEHDAPICQQESTSAIQWYLDHGYKNVFWVKIKDLGHERTPDMAADFFGRIAGTLPTRPPAALASRQAIDGNAEGLAFFAGKFGALTLPPTAIAGANANRNGSFATQSPTLRNGPRPLATDIHERRNESPPALSDMSPATANLSPLAIRVTSSVGVEQVMVAFSADCPIEWQRSANFLWTLDGAPICSGPSGQKLITGAGVHTLGVVVVTSDGQEHRSSRRINVLDRANAEVRGNNR